MEENHNKNQPNQYLIPLAIVIAGAFVAGALYFSNSGATANAPVAITDTNQPVAAAPEPTGSTDAVRPVTSEDHIKGNPNAPIKIVEYSDFECPFCKRFHDTMNEVMDKYGDSGEVAWVFRQFPLEQLHPVKAQAVAVASECAAELINKALAIKALRNIMQSPSYLVGFHHMPSQHIEISTLVF